MQELGYPCEWLDVGEFLKEWPQPGTVVKSKDGMETKIYNSILNLSFKCDGLIRFMGELYVLEIKTEISFKFLGRSGPADDHKTQATCYGACLGVKKAMFFYENRDNCSKKPYIIEVTNDDIEERVIGRIEEVNQCVEKMIPPAKTEIKKQCNYCNYKKECEKW
jgi:CRISPR/Cas system-associated exonuclease Cas4 (RecB family)